MVGIVLGDGITRKTKLYRTICKSRLLQLFSTHQNALVRPKLWDDTFENLALISEVEIDGEIATFGFKGDVYGQCWTLERFSDAMWRIYSEETDGIRIKTTVGKLLDSLASFDPKFSDVSCFIGKVRYCRDSDLNDFAETHFAEGFGTDGRKIAETLLVKRNAFSHEKEVRLIYISPSSQPAKNDVYRYSFDPHSVIDQIMLHPMLSSSERKKLKQEIRSKTGWSGELKHSKLYRKPKGYLFKVGT